MIITATANDSDGSIAKVELFNGENLITTLNTAPYTYQWANVAEGSYNISAKATDNLGSSTTSSSVAVTVAAHQAQIYDIHTDHLGTPRMVTDASGNSVWEWIGTPFGESLPNQNPQNVMGKDFVMNLRFPGQVFDGETGLHYNYYRDYDPTTGRYVQSDPIGLKGGINTYSYVGGSPLSISDPYGLDWFDNIRNTFHDWPTLILTNHYVNRSGVRISLPRRACSKYTNDPKIKRHVDNVKSGLDGNGGANVSPYGTTNYVNEIFAMGNGVDVISANCSNGSCVITVSRTDWYTDPEDKYQHEKKGKSPFSKEANKYGTPFQFDLKCDIPYTPKKECSN